MSFEQGKPCGTFARLTMPEMLERDTCSHREPTEKDLSVTTAQSTASSSLEIASGSWAPVVAKTLTGGIAFATGSFESINHHIIPWTSILKEDSWNAFEFAPFIALNFAIVVGL